MFKFNTKGYTVTEVVIVIVLAVLIIFFILPLARAYAENTKKDSLIDSAYIFIDMVRNQLASEDELPDLERALLVSYRDFKNDFKKGGKSPYDNKTYDEDLSYVAIINREGTMDFYVTLQDQSGNCLVLLNEDEVQTGSKNIRKYVRSGEDCKITPLTETQPIQSLIYKGGEENNIQHLFSIY